MPEIMILFGTAIISVTVVTVGILKRPRKPVPEIPESQRHKNAYIATGDVTELIEMGKALEIEGGK